MRGLKRPKQIQRYNKQLKTTYHVFVLSIESRRLSCLICLVAACYGSWQEDLITRWGWKSADINTSNVMVWWLIPAQSRAGSWPTHSQRAPLLTRSSHPKKMRKGGVCFLFQTVRVIFMNDLLLGLRARCKWAQRKLSAASCSGQWKESSILAVP